MTDRPLICLLSRVRQEVLREGNIRRMLANVESIVDAAVVCDDGSTDGTAEVVEAWVLGRGCSVSYQWSANGVYLRAEDLPGALHRDYATHVAMLVSPDHPERAFQKELTWKQRMLEVVHRIRPHFVLWMDADEVFDRAGTESLRRFCEQRTVGAKSFDDEVFGQHVGIDQDIAAWAFHYSQLWRASTWARTDDSFDDGWFFKLWRWTPDLEFDIPAGPGQYGGLHFPQFPRQVMQAIHEGRVARAPFEQIHYGNFGANLRWKCLQYAGGLGGVDRHLRFDRAQYRTVDPCILPEGAEQWPVVPTEHHRRTDPDPANEQEQVGPLNAGMFLPSRPQPFSPTEIARILALRNLRDLEETFTVVVPTFNRADTLDRTLQSLLDQTYERWICLVADDGSTDDTPALMRHWQDRDPRIFYARYPENRGGVSVNEIGMAVACIAGSEFVSTTLGPKMIRDVNPGDLVYGFQGEWGVDETQRSGPKREHPKTSLVTGVVTTVMRRGTKAVFKIRTRHRCVRATGDHRLLVVRQRGYAWVRCDELRRGDFVVVIKDEPDGGSPQVLPRTPKAYSTERRLRDIRSTTPELMRLVGYFLGDGYIDKDRLGRPKRLGLCEPSGSKFREYYESLCQTVLGPYKIGKRRLEFYVYSKYAASLFQALGLDKPAASKSVPEWVFRTTRAERRAVIEGYVDADGYRKSEREWRLACASLDLLQGLKALAESIGMLCSNIRRHRRAGARGRHRWIAVSYSMAVYADTLGRSEWFGGGGTFMRGKDGRDRSEFLGQPFGVDRVVAVDPDGEEPVYDLEVDQSHNFIAGGMVVHNCEWSEFWTRLGSDDWFGPRKLELDARVLSAGHDACFGAYQVLRDGNLAEICNGPVTTEQGRELLLGKRFIASWVNVAARTSVLKAVRARWGHFVDPRLKNMEDFLFNARVARVSNGWVWRGQVGDEFVVDPTPEQCAAITRRIVFNRRLDELEALWTCVTTGASGNLLQSTKDENLTRELITRDGIAEACA